MLKFSAADVTLSDINSLVDKGYRFSLVIDLDKQENVMKVEEYLNGEADVSGECRVQDDPDSGGLYGSQRD